MGEVVNLRLVRKARARSAAEQAGAANRAAFGRSKAERDGTARDAARIDRTLDGAKRDAD